MSLNYFNPVVTLYSFDTLTSGPQIAQNFEVTGEFGDELKSQDFAVLVSIWQTEEDTGGSGTTPAAHALGFGKHGKDSSPTTWTAGMSMRGTAPFKPGPATGVGLIVASTEDPTSFETYSWIRRLQIQVAPSPGSAFES